MVYRTVIDDLKYSIIFVRNRHIIDIDETVCAAGKQDTLLGWMELELCCIASSFSFQLHITIPFDYIYTHLSNVIVMALNILKTMVPG
jgi:hypothetical protein